MARLIKSGKNAGVIVLSKADKIDPNGANLIALAREQLAMRKAEEAAFAELVEDLGSVRAANKHLRQS